PGLRAAKCGSGSPGYGATSSVQMHQALHVLLQERRAHARDGDAVAMAELQHRIAVRVRGDQLRQLFSVLDVGEVVEFERVLLRIEVVDRLRALARMEHEGVIAGAADRDRGACARGRRRVVDDRTAMPVRRLLQIAIVEIVYGECRDDLVSARHSDDGIAMVIFRKVDVAHPKPRTSISSDVERLGPSEAVPPKPKIVPEKFFTLPSTSSP